MNEIKVRTLMKYLDTKNSDYYIFIPNWEYAEYMLFDDIELESWKFGKTKRKPKF